MWPFRKKKRKETGRPTPTCPHCGSTQTRAIAHGADYNDYVKTWRGQRYITCRCLKCTREFYLDEPPEGLSDIASNNDRIIEDEEELRAAEDELKRQIDAENDRRFR